MIRCRFFAPDYYPCAWSQTSAAGANGGGQGTENVSPSPYRGIFMFEFNVSADYNNVHNHIGSRLSARSIIILHLHLLRIVQ